jgi:carbonic anhydrase
MIGALDALASGDAHVAPAPVKQAAQSVSGEDALRMLLDGNARFVAGAPTRPNQSADRRCDTFTHGQHPFAAVLSCADSRVPVELLFDAGIGDLFTIRVAGNVADCDEIGTIEYGVEHLGINAILVMGHTKCGAVTAVVDHAHVTPNIQKLVDNIAPAAEAARKANPQLSGARLVEKAIRANVDQAIADLTSKSDVIRDRVKSGKLKIVGAVYDLHSGEVEWIEPSASETAHNAPEHARPADKQESDHDQPAHSDARSSADAPTCPIETAKSKVRDNLPALGGLLAGSTALSCGVFYFMRGVKV